MKEVEPMWCPECGYCPPFQYQLLQEVVCGFHGCTLTDAPTFIHVPVWTDDPRLDEWGLPA